MEVEKNISPAILWIDNSRMAPLDCEQPRTDITSPLHLIYISIFHHAQFGSHLMRLSQHVRAMPHGFNESAGTNFAFVVLVSAARIVLGETTDLNTDQSERVLLLTT